MPNVLCKMCGAPVGLREGVFSDTCEYCGGLITLPKIETEEQERLYNRAEHFRRLGEFDKAIRAYAQIVAAVPDDPEAHWGMVLSRYGIEYVEDPASHQRIPTCHRVSTEPVLTDADYLAAVENAGDREREIYEKEAERIEQIRKGILAISTQEQPFDVFICYKESDEYGQRTRDSVAAQEIYYALTEAGYKVFFSRITLESKLGQQYEPYIFAALNSARVMLVVGSSPAHFNAAWVRNEWSRYLELMKTDRRKLLIPCFRDMDAYELPGELSMFQSQDMGRIGFIQDLLRGIKKVIAVDGNARMESPPPAAAGGSENPLVVRARMLVEIGDFDAARGYCERALDADPRNGYAYFYLLMAESGVSDEASLPDIPDLCGKKSFLLARKCADSGLAEKLNKIEGWAMLNVSDHVLYGVKDNGFAKKMRRLFIPGSVKMIWIGAFKGCTSLQSVVIPDSVTKIGESAFKGCTSLQSVVIPKSVNKIGDGAFEGCSSLQSVVIPDSVTEIGWNAFNGCSSLQNVVIPDSVTKIGWGAFKGCSSLQNVVIPNSVNKIGDCAFKGCSSLQSVVIPNSVTEIKESTFRGCSSLQEAAVGNDTRIVSAAFRGTPCEERLKAEHKGQFVIMSREDMVVLVIIIGMMAVGLLVNLVMFSCM